MNCASPQCRLRSSWVAGTKTRPACRYWNPNSPNQLLESDVGPEAVENGIENLQNPDVSFRVGFLQRFQSQIRLAQARVNHPLIVGADVFRFRLFLHFAENFPGTFSIAVPGIRIR